LRLLKISTAYAGSDKTLADRKIEEKLEELQPLNVFQPVVWGDEGTPTL
jgi:exonuclease SbcD